MSSEETYQRWPNFPVAATPEYGRMGHGRGFTREDCDASALGEMIEIASCCAWGNEELKTANLDDLGSSVWPPTTLSGFSDNQFQNRNEWNSKLSGLDRIPKPLSPDLAIEWMQAELLTGNGSVWIAADSILIGRSEIGDTPSVAVADTNGCASGSSRETAQLSAIYELIERDATGRWWYGGRIRPHIDPQSIEHGSAIHDHINKRDRLLYILDITTDIGIPTVAAISCNQQGRAIAGGFATRADYHQAAQSALSELMQMELRIEISRSHPEVAGDLAEWIEEVSLKNAAPFILSDRVGSGESAAQSQADLKICLYNLERAHCEVAIVDMTREEFGLPVIHAISPDLCHWKPRFGRARLLANDSRDLGRQATWRNDINPVLLRV